MQIIDTREVNCKDCHRCLRVCPVKAIGLLNGHAQVLDERCILCGKCVVECPQHAKRIVSRLEEVKAAIAAGRRVVISLGSAYLGWFDEYRPEFFYAMLRQVGFHAVTETAQGAEAVAAAYRHLFEHHRQPLISSNCPVVTGLVKKYYPSLTKYLAPVVSPMAAHGRILRRRFGGDAFIVFAGPCIGKLNSGEMKPNVDAVITFAELRQWLREEGAAAKLPPDAAALPDTAGAGRIFPLSGGILKLLLNLDRLSTDVIAADGIENCIDVFENMAQGTIFPRFVEAFSCTGGCIGGPMGGTTRSLSLRRLKMLERAKRLDDQTEAAVLPAVDLSCEHHSEPVAMMMPGEEEIRKILRKTGKFTRADEKNCGACGYKSCREKAVAVWQGVAEITMCMPYMRSKAESFAGIVVENAPYGIVTVDRNMQIQDFNPAMSRMFAQKRPMHKGVKLKEYIDCEDFLAAISGQGRRIDKRKAYPEYGIITDQTLIPAMKNSLVIGIIADVTGVENAAAERRRVREAAVAQATEIINQQMKVAQEIAGLLGETTADTKSALLEMMQTLQKRKEDF